MNVIRQGDVLLKPISKIPKNVVNKDRTLAWGEITGHHHTLQAGKVFVNNGGIQFCELETDTVLEHQDHANIIIPKGLYEVVIQREFDVVEGVRQVLD